MEPIDPIVPERLAPLPVSQTARTAAADRDGHGGGGASGERRRRRAPDSEDAVEVAIDGVSTELESSASSDVPAHRVDLQA